MYPSPIHWRRRSRVPYIRLRNPDRRNRQSEPTFPPSPSRPVHLRSSHLALCPAPTLPSCADNGERSVHKEREDRLEGQMAEEYIQVLLGHGVHCC